MVIGLGASYTPSLLPKPEKKPGYCWEVGSWTGNSSQYVQDFDRRKHGHDKWLLNQILEKPPSSLKLWKGDIAIYPEFTGTVTESLLKPAPPSRPWSRSSLSSGSRWDQKQDDLALLKPMAYQNTYAVAVPKKIAQEYGLKTISDLKRWKDNSRQALPWSLMTERTGTRACRRFTDSIYKISTMEPAPSLPGDPVRWHPDHRCLLNGCRAGSLWPGGPWRW